MPENKARSLKLQLNPAKEVVVMTQRNRAWRRRQYRRIVDKIHNSQQWLHTQLFQAKDISPMSSHMVNPKKSQLQKLHGHIQAVKESLRANDDLWEGAEPS
jgi:hypothetical protein